MREQKLSEAEGYIMGWFWEKGEMKADDLAALVAARGWKRSTLLTFLSRLEDKGMLAVERRKKQNEYRPIVTRAAYQQAQSKVFLEDMYGGSAKDFLSAMVTSSGISKQELAELRRWLLEQEVNPDV